MTVMDCRCAAVLWRSLVKPSAALAKSPNSTATMPMTVGIACLMLMPFAASPPHPAVPSLCAFHLDGAAEILVAAYKGSA